RFVCAVTTPDHHDVPRPHGTRAETGRGRGGVRRGAPGVGPWIVAPSRIQFRGSSLGAAVSAPDPHHVAGPYGRVIMSAPRGTAGGRGRPRIRHRVVSSSRRGVVEPAPYDHLGSGPDRGMHPAWGGSVQVRNGRPDVGYRIVAGSVIHGQRSINPAP